MENTFHTSELTIDYGTGVDCSSIWIYETKSKKQLSKFCWDLPL